MNNVLFVLLFSLFIMLFTLCLKKSSSFLFLWLLGQMLTDFNNILLYCSWENLQRKGVFLSYNIQFVYKYHRIEKQERFCMLSMQKSKDNASTKHEKKTIRLLFRPKTARLTCSLVYWLLYHSPDLVVHRIQICAVCWLQVWGDELAALSDGETRPCLESGEPACCLAGNWTVHQQFGVLRAAFYRIAAHHGSTCRSLSLRVPQISTVYIWHGDRHHEWLAEGRTCTEESVEQQPPVSS